MGPAGPGAELPEQVAGPAVSGDAVRHVADDRGARADRRPVADPRAGPGGDTGAHQCALPHRDIAGEARADGDVGEVADDDAMAGAGGRIEDRVAADARLRLHHRAGMNDGAFGQFGAGRNPGEGMNQRGEGAALEAAGDVAAAGVVAHADYQRRVAVQVRHGIEATGADRCAQHIGVPQRAVIVEQADDLQAQGPRRLQALPGVSAGADDRDLMHGPPSPPFSAS
jgi:hypothetical protein